MAWDTRPTETLNELGHRDGGTGLFRSSWRDSHQGRVLLVWGEEEQTIPFGDVEAYMATTEDSAKSNKLVTIPGSDHGYGFYSYPPQPEIDEALHKAFIDFFKKALR